MRRKKSQRWKGQRQKWFAVRLVGKESDFDLKAHPPIEFSSWRWGELAEAPTLIVPFKRNVYERVACEFKAFANKVE